MAALFDFLFIGLGGLVLVFLGFLGAVFFFLLCSERDNFVFLIIHEMMAYILFYLHFNCLFWTSDVQNRFFYLSIFRPMKVKIIDYLLID